MSKINEVRKYLIFLSILWMALASCSVSNSKTDKAKSAVSNLNAYNSEKAKKYGSDEFGMKKYVIAFLKSGPNRETDPVKAMELQKAHLMNINKMAEAGKLVAAGPFLDNGDLRGIYIFNVETIEEAKKLTETDPSVISGNLVMELKLWYGSAALMEVNEIHNTLTKSDIIN
jgi:uncharacterized protein